MIKRYLVSVFGAESIIPEAAAASVAACLEEWSLDGEAERARLESECTPWGTAGSNPAGSALAA